MRRSTPLSIILIFAGWLLPWPGEAANQNQIQSSRARVAIEQGNYQHAIDLLNKAIRMNPREHRYYNDRGVAYKQAGRMDLALADYTKALRIKPDYASSLNNRGVLYLEKGQYKEATADFTAALSLKGPTSKIYANRGLAYLRSGEIPKAIEDFRQSIILKPPDPRSFLFMAESLDKLGDKAKALKMYELASEVTTDRQLLASIKERSDRLKTGGKIDDSRGGTHQSPAKHEAPKQELNSHPVASSQISTRLATDKKVGSLPRTGEDGSSHTRELLMSGELQDAYSGIYRPALEKAATKIAPDVLRAHAQGLDFLKASETQKALIRFEDARQLALRKTNAHGVAWALFEIGRLHAGARDYLKAIRHFEAALDWFRRAQARDEEVLTLVELELANLHAGLKQKVVSLHSETRKKALAAGHGQLASALDDVWKRMENESTARRAVASSTKPALKQEPEVSAPPLQATESSPRTRQLTLTPNDSPDKVGAARLHAGIAREESRTRPMDYRPQDHRQPERQVFRPAGFRPRETGNLQRDLDELRKLRAAGDEPNMIVVLERLAAKYAEQNNHEKAFECLLASQSLREKLGLRRGIAKVHYAVGVLREELGRKTQAIEDLARAAVVGGIESESGLTQAAEARARKLARGMKLDDEQILGALKAYWKARAARESEAEIRALYRAARLYQTVGLDSEALGYMERAAAVMLGEQAGLLARTGKSAEAKRALAQALGVLKAHDYSRYLQLIEKGKTLQQLSTHKSEAGRKTR